MDENHQDKTESIPPATATKVSAPSKKKVGMPKRKSKWPNTPAKWIKLLGIPLTIGLTLLGLIIGFITFELQQAANQSQALDQQQATILQTYIDNIQDLMLNHNLLQSSSRDPKNPYYNIAILARVRTLIALQELDQGRKGLSVRKGLILIFLHEAKLIGFSDKNGKPHDPIIDLTGADLSGADITHIGHTGADLSNVTLTSAFLDGADLTSANLSEANLTGADLNGANLTGANLNDAILNNAVLIGATLTGAYIINAALQNAIFTSATLQNAILTSAYLSGANLSEANLRGAYIVGANLRGAIGTSTEGLAQAKSLQGTTMPDGSIHP